MGTKIRNANGQFPKGTSGNPTGRPVGSRNRSALLLEQLLEGQSEDLLRQLIKRAKRGDIRALQICIDRLIPIRKHRPVALEIESIQSAADLSKAYQAIWAGVANGEIAPTEAEMLSNVLSCQAQSRIAIDLEQRVQKLEEHLSEVEAYNLAAKTIPQNPNPGGER